LHRREHVESDGHVLEGISMKMRIVVPLALLTFLPACNPASEVPLHRDSSELPAAGATTPTARAAIALAKLQNRSGAFEGPSKTDHIGITAIAGLALLSATDVAPSTTQPHVQRAANFLLAAQGDDGFFNKGFVNITMYDHAFATLFLTQVYATTSDEKFKTQLRPAIEKSVRLIEKAQNQEGGWRYQPVPQSADVSVSAAQLKALAAAKDAGFKVSQPSLDRAIAYIKSNQQADGGFSYTLQGGASGWARSAAATAALLYAGVAETDAAKAMDYIKKNTATPNAEGHYYYGTYYLAQTLNLNPEDTTTAAALRTAILQKQDASSYLWTSEMGTPYATSIALIILNMPHTNLPAFKKPLASATTAPATRPEAATPPPTMPAP
jgi:prenyltransferase beta subunit